MRLAYPKLVIRLLASTILTTISHASYAEVGPLSDPDIPSYIARDSLSGKLTISVSEAMKPLVQAWANDLIRLYPDLRITVISERSQSSLAMFLAHRTEITAMSRRMTPIELGNCLLELGHQPIALPVAHHTTSTSVRNDDPNTGTFLSQHVEPLRPIALVPHRSEHQPSIRLGSSRYDVLIVRPRLVNGMKHEWYVKPAAHRDLDNSRSIQRSVYLYIAKLPGPNARETSTELIRYALSWQGQQLALDLGYVPLSLEEVRRVTSRWSATRR